MTFNELTHTFNLEGRANFWKYLQMRHCVTSKFKKIAGNEILNYIRLPRDRHSTSQFYKLISYDLSGESSNIKLLWQKDLGIESTKEKWLSVLSDSG